MGVMQRFEKRLSGLVEGGFARVFRGRVEPVELAAALAREADNNKAVGPHRVLVPNVYEVELGRADHDRLAPYALTLGDELAVMVSEHAAEQGYSFVGPVTVTIQRHDGLSTGSFRVESRVEAGAEPVAPRAPGRPAPVFPPVRDAPVFAPQGEVPIPSAPPIHPGPVPVPGRLPVPGALPVPGPFPARAGTPGDEPVEAPETGESASAPAPVPDPNVTTVMPPPAPPTPQVHGRLELPDGSVVEITQLETVLGRGTNADVRITDASVSRRHAKLTVVGRAVTVEDLGSTNGTTRNGARTSTRETLADGDRIGLGAAAVTFRS